MRAMNAIKTGISGNFRIGPHTIAAALLAARGPFRPGARLCLAALPGRRALFQKGARSLLRVFGTEQILGASVLNPECLGK